MCYLTYFDLVQKKFLLLTCYVLRPNFSNLNLRFPTQAGSTVQSFLCRVQMDLFLALIDFTQFSEELRIIC